MPFIFCHGGVTIPAQRMPQFTGSFFCARACVVLFNQVALCLLLIFLFFFFVETLRFLLQLEKVEWTAFLHSPFLFLFRFFLHEVRDLFLRPLFPHSLYFIYFACMCCVISSLHEQNRVQDRLSEGTWMLPPDPAELQAAAAKKKMPWWKG